MADNTQFNLDDMTLDDLYPQDNTTQQTPQEPAGGTTPEPQTLSPKEPFLRTSTGTIYNTQEEAERGIAEKDRALEQSRQWTIAMTGYDPISGKPARATPYTEEINYVRDPEKFYDDLVAAQAKGDKRAYALINMKMMDSLMDQYRPALTQSARATALENAERARPGIREFVGTDKYKNYLEQVPLLRDAMSAAETRPEMSTQLQDLFILTFDGATGRSVPEILKTAKAQAQPANPAPVRPTLQPMSQPVGGTPASAPDMSTPEGRKAIIDGARSRGIEQRMAQALFSQGA